MTDDSLWDLNDEPGGNCPVQWEGLVAGYPAYFRARGQHWAMHIDPRGFDGFWQINCMWWVERQYSDDPFEAGWMSVEEAKGFIVGAILTFLSERRLAP